MALDSLDEYEQLDRLVCDELNVRGLRRLIPGSGAELVYEVGRGYWFERDGEDVTTQRLQAILPSLLASWYRNLSPKRRGAT